MPPELFAPNPPSKARRFAPRDTSRKRDVHFTPISSPPCLNMDLRPCWLRRYNDTHDQLNIIDILLSFFRNFFEGGGRKIQVCPRAPDTLATPLGAPNHHEEKGKKWGTFPGGERMPYNGPSAGAHTLPRADTKGDYRGTGHGRPSLPPEKKV